MAELEPTPIDNGLLVNGQYKRIPGLVITSPGPGAPPWITLSPRDYQARHTTWVRQVIAHTTKGVDPQHTIPGSGPGGRGKVVADFWNGDPEHSAAQIVIDNNGHVYALCDIARTCAYHATVSNEISVGVEMYQELGGGVYEAVYRAAELLFPALCDLFQIPRQIHFRPYAKDPLDRMLNPATRDKLVGIFGHRDNTTRRGRGDPGDEFYLRMVAQGVEGLDFVTGQDLAAWKLRQAKLNTLGEKLIVDGVCGPSTMQAMRRHGFDRGADVAAAPAMPRPSHT